MEEILSGGNMSVVVRIGETVHRTAGPWTETVHALLAHLRSVGIRWVPEPLGRDERGREVLSFVEGTVPEYPMPEWVWSDTILAECARGLRELHDASLGILETMRRAGVNAVWQLPEHHPAEVICHNDFAQYNLAFVDGHFAGAIDFDTASPGPRIWDLAYLAYRLVPLTGSELTDDTAPAASQRDRRLAELIAAYGMPFTEAELIDTVVSRLDELADFSEERAVALVKPELVEHASRYRSDARRLASRRC